MVGSLKTRQLMELPVLGEIHLLEPSQHLDF